MYPHSFILHVITVSIVLSLFKTKQSSVEFYFQDKNAILRTVIFHAFGAWAE